MALALEELIVVVGLTLVALAHFGEWVIKEICKSYNRTRRRIRRSLRKRR